MKITDPVKRQELIAAAQSVVNAINAEWDAEGDVEELLGHEVPDMREYFTERAAFSDAPFGDDDLDDFLAWEAENDVV